VAGSSAEDAVPGWEGDRDAAGVNNSFKLCCIICQPAKTLLWLRCMMLWQLHDVTGDVTGDVTI
jgi:hypothetical protein